MYSGRFQQLCTSLCYSLELYTLNSILLRELLRDLRFAFFLKVRSGFVSAKYLPSYKCFLTLHRRISQGGLVLYNSSQVAAVLNATVHFSAKNTDPKANIISSIDYLPVFSQVFLFIFILSSAKW